jgi:hypothetical protein
MRQRKKSECRRKNMICRHPPMTMSSRRDLYCISVSPLDSG